jgi:Mg/Co/Ni transporter MgtE
MSSSLRKIKTVLVPIGTGMTGQTALNLAQAIAEEVVLVGIVPITTGESVSAGAQTARLVRKRLLSLSNASTRFKSTVIVSESPWKDLLGVISFEKPDLFIVEWKDGQIPCGVPVTDILSNSLCNVAILRGTTPLKFERTLIAVRGGPYAELALQAGMSLHPAQLDVLHLALTGAENDTPVQRD